MESCKEVEVDDAGDWTLDRDLLKIVGHESDQLEIIELNQENMRMKMEFDTGFAIGTIFMFMTKGMS